MTRKIVEIPTGYGSEYQPKMREPVLVDSFAEAEEIQEKEIMEKVEKLIDDLQTIFATVDGIVSDNSLFKATSKYFVDKDQWLELQGKISELDPRVDKQLLWEMERDVTTYQCESQLKGANHLQGEVEKLNSCLDTVSHLMAHLTVMREGLVGNCFNTRDADFDEPPF